MIAARIFLILLFSVRDQTQGTVTQDYWGKFSQHIKLLTGFKEDWIGLGDYIKSEIVENRGYVLF